MLYEDSGLTFEYGYDSDATSSYLVLQLNSDIKLLNHQVEIICQNPNSAFVPFHIRRENENEYIYYNITSKISLSQYLERKRLNKKELLDLLKNITKNILLHDNYLLDLSSFIIHPDFIYINPATVEVSLLYVPAPCDRDTMEVYRSFLKNLVVNSANVDDNAIDNYLQRILNYLKSDTFSLVDFKRLIIDLRNTGSSYKQPTKAAGEYAETLWDEGRSFKDNAGGRLAERKNILKIMLLQLLIILAAAIACLFVMSRMKGDPASITGVMLIAIALDVLIMKRIAGKPNKKTSEEDRDARVEGDGSRSFQNVVYKRPHSPHRGKRQEAALTSEILKACDTVMISEVPLDKHPYLESVGTHNGERIIINKEKYIIGRLGSMVDHLIQGSTVGKLHAEITGDEGGYYLRDLNSKNGTYINDVRITSNKECEIKNNDRIRFSSHEYIFRQQ